MNKQGFARTLLFTSCLALLTIGITSCYHFPSYNRQPVLKNMTRWQHNQIFAIQKTGIQVIKYGMRFTFLIPVDDFFSLPHNELRENRTPALDKLANFLLDYMQYLGQPQITVTGYTDKVLLKPARVKLSRHYADSIADYLAEDGVPLSIMKVRGMGASNSIGSNAYPMGASFNRRVVVEIR